MPTFWQVRAVHYRDAKFSLHISQMFLMKTSIYNSISQDTSLQNTQQDSTTPGMIDGIALNTSLMQFGNS